MGKGVIQDYKMAAKWYKLSAEQGGSSAQLNLSDMYSDGKGVIQDDVYAHMWANIARANGVGYAGDRITSIEGYMSRSQIEKAQDLARECVAKNYKNC